VPRFSTFAGVSKDVYSNFSKKLLAFSLALRHCNLMRTAIFLILFAAVATAAEPIIREDGVIYLFDHDQKPLQVPLAKPAQCFFDRGLTRFAGTLRFPQTVKIEAFAPGVCRIFGLARQGGVAAWIPIDALEPLPENFLKELDAAEQRRVMVNDLIAKNEVVPGMTQEEVRRSLGRPQKTSRSVTDAKERVTWEYIKYELVPQQMWVPWTHGGGGGFAPMPPRPGRPGGGGGGPAPAPPSKPPPGRPGGGGGGRPSAPLMPSQSGFTTDMVLQIVNVKTPVGTMAINFENNIVVSIDETNDNPR